MTQKFDKLFGDVLSMSYALDKHTELLPEQYYSLLTRDGEQFILPLRDGLEQSMDGVLALIREKGARFGAQGLKLGENKGACLRL